MSQPGEVIRVAVRDYNRGAMKRLGTQHMRVRDADIAPHVFLFSAVYKYDLTVRSLDHRAVALPDVNEPHLQHRAIAETRLFRQKTVVFDEFVFFFSFAPFLSR